MATNISINRLLGKLLKQKFTGVFPIHYGLVEIKKMKAGNCLLINSGCADKLENGHFIAVLKPKKGDLLIFDSFSNENGIKLLLHPVLDEFETVKINKSKIQSNKSNYCGIFASAFVLTYYKKKKLSDFFKIIDYDDLANNDRIVSIYLKKLVKNIVSKQQG